MNDNGQTFLIKQLHTWQAPLTKEETSKVRRETQIAAALTTHDSRFTAHEKVKRQKPNVKVKLRQHSLLTTHDIIPSA
jgi:hypothetical protein